MKEVVPPVGTGKCDAGGGELCAQLLEGQRLEDGEAGVSLERLFHGNPAKWLRQVDRPSAEDKLLSAAGSIGAGNITKLANQIIVALNIAAMSEALVLASKAGVEPELVYQAISGGLAGSTVLDAKAPLVLDRKFDPGFRIELHIKDLANVLETAHEIGVPLPLTAGVMEIMQALKVDGMQGLDHGALVRYYEKAAQVEVSR